MRSPADAAEIERACTKLIVAYTHLVDFGRAEEAPDLFTPDGVFVATPEFQVNGREEIRAMFGAAQSAGGIGRHLCTNIAVDVIDGDHATGLTYVTIFRHDPPVTTPAPMALPAMIATYRDEFERTDEGWRIARRVCDLAFAAMG